MFAVVRASCKYGMNEGVDGLVPGMLWESGRDPFRPFYGDIQGFGKENGNCYLLGVK